MELILSVLCLVLINRGLTQKVIFIKSYSREFIQKTSINRVIFRPEPIDNSIDRHASFDTILAYLALSDRVSPEKVDSHPLPVTHLQMCHELCNPGHLEHMNHVLLLCQLLPCHIKYLHFFEALSTALAPLAPWDKTATHGRCKLEADVNDPSHTDDFSMCNRLFDLCIDLVILCIATLIVIISLINCLHPLEIEESFQTRDIVTELSAACQKEL